MKNLAFTLGQRRSNHAYRVAAAADSLDELKEQLSALKPRKIRDRVLSFVFTGQGAQ
jgi:acyl transferase domain-containing protein